MHLLLGMYAVLVGSVVEGIEHFNFIIKHANLNQHNDMIQWARLLIISAQMIEGTVPKSNVCFIFNIYVQTTVVCSIG